MKDTQRTTRKEQKISASNTASCDATGSKPKGSPIADVHRCERKVQCYIKIRTGGTWNVRCVNQGKLEVVKHEMDRLNINILGISGLKWTGIGHFQSGEYRVSYARSDSIRRNRVAKMLKANIEKTVLGYNAKTDRVISMT